MKKPEISSAIRRIAVGIAVASALFVAVASAAAAPAEAAAKTPFKAQGVFASCGKGKQRTTAYMTFLSLRSERGFDDVKALLRHGDEVRPRAMKIRLPGKDRARKLRSIGASLPDFLFVDYLETKAGPGAAARERSTISWQSKKSSGKRVRSSLRLRDLGNELCEPAHEKAAGKASVDQARMLREAAPAPEAGADPAPAKPEANDGSGGDAAKREGFPCPEGTYYGRADDGTEISLSYDGYVKVSQIHARAQANGLSYEVGLPDTNSLGLWSASFVTGVPASQTEFGYSPEAVMHGHCSADDRFTVTIRDRAGERTATLSRAVLEPGWYEGSVWAQNWPRSYSHVTIRFRIYPEGHQCYSKLFDRYRDCPVDGPTFSGTLANVRTGVGETVWLDAHDFGHAWVGADRCQFGFSAHRGAGRRTGEGEGQRLETHATCERGNRVAGDLLWDGANRSTPHGLFYAKQHDLSWEAYRVGD